MNDQNAEHQIWPTDVQNEAKVSNHVRYSGVVRLASSNLAELLQLAREALVQQGASHVTQRGVTRTLNLMIMTWQAPHILDPDALPWTQEDVGWYLRVFVDRSEYTDPLHAPVNQSLLFPYTYAARARFFDGGWGQLYRLLASLRQGGFSLVRAAQSSLAMENLVAFAAEQLHIQTVLSLLSLYPLDLLERFAWNEDQVLAIAKAWNRDCLMDAIEEIRRTPESRRATVGPLSLPHIEHQLSPQMGKPAYQLFQLLPDSAQSPISSVHEHRSLDIIGGAQLDFAHDYSWLALASSVLHRPIGDITIIAHNAHQYEKTHIEREQIGERELEESGYNETIKQWLCFVTDGYAPDHGIGNSLVQQPVYRAGIERIARKWHGDSDVTEQA